MTGPNPKIKLNGILIGEVEDMDLEFTAERDPPYWCPSCKKPVTVAIKGDPPLIVCSKCGSSEIGTREDAEFNPSRRYKRW